MSVDEQTPTPGAEFRTEPHHSTTPTNTAMMEYVKDLGRRGFFCTDCGAKCTIGLDGSSEYGHFPACSHSIRDSDRDLPAANPKETRVCGWCGDEFETDQYRGAEGCCPRHSQLISLERRKGKGSDE